MAAKKVTLRDAKENVDNSVARYKDQQQIMANNFVHHGGRACESQTRYFLNLAVNKITKKCMRICLTVLKIVL